MVYNLRRFFLFRIGNKETERPLDFFSGITNALTFGIGQRKIISSVFMYAAIMHFLLAWGFIELLFATTVDFFSARAWFSDYLPEFDTPWFAAINDLGGVMLFGGLVMAIYRRHGNKPEPLPQNFFKGRKNLLGDTGILLLLIMLVLQGFFTEASRLAVERPLTANWSWIGYPISKWMPVSAWEMLQPGLWWFHAVTALIFISILPLTKLFHSLATLINLALTNRKYLGQLRPMHITRLMENPDTKEEDLTFGASKVEDFTWKQLLDSIACTECARCTTVCPAYITKKPLSPMKIITDIRHDLYSKALGSNNHEGLIGGRIDIMELWSCTTCGACLEECPVLIDTVPTITDMRRHLVLSEGKPPAQANFSLDKTKSNGNPWGFPQSERIKWATDAEINLPIMADKENTCILYWVGCAGSFDPKNQKVSRAMVKIFESAGIDFAALGNEEMCTGDSARRLGEEYLFETMALKNIETLNQYNFETIVTACPHCFHTLKNEYPQFGGNYHVKHHSQFINELISSEKLSSKKYKKQKVAYHDSCYLGRINGEYDAPRRIIQKILDEEGKLVEMQRNKKESFCCGAGGGNMWHEIDKGERINLNRLQEAVDSGVDTVATACPFCMIMIDDAMKLKGKEESMEVLDIAEIVAQGLS
tara:strand:+ start:15784 stop:17733 length:1950 start_codon:yes stop_codon:yes gene_type:complete